MENINLIVVFIEGLLSFFSPCVLPIIPVYLSILSNSSSDVLDNTKFKNSTLFRNTLFFTLGISTTFFLLSMTVGLFSQFFIDSKEIIILIGGASIVVMGLFYIGCINIPFLQQEKRFKIKTNDMNILTSYILGLTFSFGWTPCIGPMLSSVLIMASSSEKLASGNILVLIYSLGFILPFIIVALFYKKIFEKFNNMKKYISTFKIIGGILLIISGLPMVVTGIKDMKSDSKENSNTQIEYSNESDKNKAVDFTLYDQYGVEHKLSDYKGKTVFLNIWATWCPPCREEMPYIEEIYNEYNKNNEEVVILGVATPNIGGEGNKDYITNFLNENKYTFPVVFDNNMELINAYGVQAFPSTFIIDKEGYIREYVPGGMNKETMKYLIENNK